MSQEEEKNGELDRVVVDETLGTQPLVDGEDEVVPLTTYYAVQILSNVESNLEIVRKELEERFPNLAIKTISYLAEGLDHIAYRVNDDYIFRIPKAHKTSGQLMREVWMMPLVAQHTNIPVPKYEYISEGNRDDKRWIVGCKLFRGEQLTTTSFNKLSTDQKENILGDTATFLQTIHRIPVTKVLECSEIDEINYEDVYTWDATSFFPGEIFPLLTEDEKQKVSSLFKMYLGDPENFSYRPVPLHGDMKLEHMFTNLETKHIQGVIDFEPMVGDADYDFMRLYDELDRESFQRLLVMYGHSDSKRCESKVQVFHLCRYARKFRDFRNAGKRAESSNAWEKVKAVIAELPQAA